LPTFSPILSFGSDYDAPSIKESRANGSFLERLSKETNMATVSKELDALTSQVGHLR
jgi:hypothetical protein